MGLRTRLSSARCVGDEIWGTRPEGFRNSAETCAQPPILPGVFLELALLTERGELAPLPCRASVTAKKMVCGTCLVQGGNWADSDNGGHFTIAGRVGCLE